MTRPIKVGFAAIFLAAAAIAAAQQIAVQVDGQSVYFPGAQPQYVNGRVLVPLRGIFQHMGATVDWNPQTQMVTARRNGTDVELRIGDRQALVNGTTMNLDVPAMIVRGSTMVPIRFVSEALGAQVGWLEAQRLVTVDTTMAGDYNGTIHTPPQTLRHVIVRENAVIPVTLDKRLSTQRNRKGDRFTATVQSGYFGDSDIPSGTKVEGHIAALRPKRGDDPAILDLSFDRLLFPNGRTATIDGTLTSLDSKDVTRNGNGVLVAKNSNPDRRLVYAGYGAGGGLLLGVLTKKPLEGTILGGILGYLYGQVNQSQRHEVTDVNLKRGTEMGIRLDRDLAVNWR